MVRVNISPLILRWVKHRNPSLASGFPDLEKWIRGEARPTLRQLRELAKKAYIPLGYFFFTEPPKEELSIPFFRTHKDKGFFSPSANFVEILHTLQRRQTWMQEYLIAQGRAPLAFVGAFSPAADPTKVSREIRRVLGLKEDWTTQQPTWKKTFQTLWESAEKAGIVVVSSSIVGNNSKRALDSEEFRGFVLIDSYVPFIFINAADAKAAQLFTLAHELAHIWLGKSAAFDLEVLQPAEDEVEKACNRIAAEFLVPSEGLKDRWKGAASEKPSLQDLAKEFKVSELVIARRAWDLGLICKDQFFEFYDGYIARERKKKPSGGGDFYTTQLSRLGGYFARTVSQAVREGSLLYHEAYRLTGLYGKTFAHLAEKLQKSAS